MSEIKKRTEVDASCAHGQDEIPAVTEGRLPAIDRKRASDVMKSIGECVYEWDLAKDEISWSEDAENLLCLPDTSRISSNRALSQLMLPSTQSSREEVVHSAACEDRGQGAPYRFQYALCGEKIGTGSNI